MDKINIKVRKLTSELAKDYIRFFDTTPHDDNIDENKCYCVCWCNDDFEGKDFSTAEKRREYAYKYVKNNNIQGYLAYYDDKVVGWCNVNTKSDCLKCESWRKFMSDAPIEDASSIVKVKSVFCFVIAPKMRRKGVATLLLKHVCENAAKDGFDFVEAYPYKEPTFQSSDFAGYVEMYKRCGFYVFSETDQRLIMRKRLK